MITTDTGAKKLEGTDNWRQIIQAHNDSVDAHDAGIEGLQDALGIVVDGDQAAVSASTGQYIILKNSTITGCTDGLYTATKAIPANTAIDNTYLSAVSGGGLNALNTQLADNSEILSNTGGLTIYRFGKLRAINFSGNGLALPTVGAIIPIADRPPRIVRVPATTQNDVNGFWVSIETDGKINLYKGGNAITSGLYNVFFSATYIVNS